MVNSIYATPEQVRRQLGMESDSGTASDPALLALIQTISQELDNHYNNTVGFIALETAAAFPFPNLTLGRVETPFFIEVEKVMTGDVGDFTDEIPVDDVTPFSGSWRRPNYFRTPYTGLILPVNNANAIEVTARWGYADKVPPLINQITIALVIRAFKQGESGWSDVLASFDMGQMVYARENSDLRLMMKSGSRMFRNVSIA